MANQNPKTDHLKQFQFPKGTSGNKKGRPKKFFSKVLASIKKHGENVDANAVQEVYQVMMSLDESQIKEIVENKGLPMLYRIIGKRMLAKDGFEVIEKMMDRANGYPIATQKVQGIDTTINITLPEPDEEIQRQWEAAKNKSIEKDGEH